MNSYSPGISRARAPTTTVISGGAPPGQDYTGNGLPAVTPNIPTSPASYESLDLNLFFDWDTNGLKWRSRGVVEEVTTLNLQANVWTRLPPTALLTQITNYRIFRQLDNLELDTFAERPSPIDGWPEIESLSAYTALTVRCFGDVVI